MTELPVLEPDDQRILGSLLEKQTTVPASYPLTANALRSACNQTSNRDPVVDLDQQAVEQTARSLKERGLLRIVWSDTGRRTLKYHQVLDEVLGLAPDERALLTMLLLRGPQAPGELRTAHRAAARVRRPGRGGGVPARDGGASRAAGARARAAARAAGPALGAPAGTGAGAGRGRRRRDGGPGGRDRRGADERDAAVRSSYDAVATAYADQLVDELRGLPFETWLLDRVLAAGRRAAGGRGRGAGPGHVTAYLAEGGADATGLDLSPAMVAEARRRFPGLAASRSATCGGWRRPATSSGWAAVLAWYSLIHLAASELPDAVAALARPLDPGGWLVLGLHAGAEVRHLDEWFGHDVDLDFVLHEPAFVAGVVEAAGLVDVEWYLRGPVAARGETTQRLYVVGRRPG